MSDAKNANEAQAPEAEEHHEEHNKEEHHKKHGDRRFHPEKFRREHAVIHPSESGVSHLDSGAIVLK